MGRLNSSPVHTVAERHIHAEAEPPWRVRLAQIGNDVEMWQHGKVVHASVDGAV